MAYRNAMQWYTASAGLPGKGLIALHFWPTDARNNKSRRADTLGPAGTTAKPPPQQGSRATNGTEPPV